MRTARPSTIFVITFGVGVIFMLVTLTTPAHQHHARSRFKVDIKETHHAPDFFGADCNALKLLLDSNEEHRAVAMASMVDEKDFALRKIGPVRGTALGCLEYSGVDSNLVERVASNAARIVIRFYATNQPGWEVTYIDSYCFPPPPLTQRLKWFIGL